jgi:ribonucleoside-diphosphate reductase alpha chain
MIFESELAKQVFESKYLLEGEKTPEEAINRIVRAVSKIYPEIADEAYEYIDKQWFIPAGGIWRAASNPNKNVSFINCTTLAPVEDDLESIFKSLYYWGKYAAFGQGEGIDISKLRPRGSKVHNSSRTSTGAVSFMKLYNAVLDVIAQQGRRGASLISLKDNHPDIEEFITVKDKDGVLETANLSIQISDEFMLAVKNDLDWTLRFDNKYESINKVIKARDLFNLICDHAHARGDPGLQFIDKARSESNSDALGYPIVSTNACSEQWLNPNSTCTLSHLNLAKYNEYGYSGFKKLIRFGVYFLNAINQIEILNNRSPVSEQKDTILDLPRIGLGVSGLADFFIHSDLVYASEESIIITQGLFKDIAGIAYKTGNEIGKKYGSFKAYDKSKILKSKYIQRLLSENIITDSDLDYQSNVCYLTIAPVGSGSIISNNGGSGVEPMFSKYMVRRERSTTGDWKDWFIYNPLVEQYMNTKGIELTRQNVNKLIDPIWATSYKVDALSKLKLISIIQKYVDSSVSVTFNIPKESKVQLVKDIYTKAWELGLKGITVYREGSRTGVLITEENYDEMKVEDSDPNRPIIIQRTMAPKRPKEVISDIHEITLNKEKYIVTVGKVKGCIYEIFLVKNTLDTNTNEYIIDVQKHKEGLVVKRSKGNYDLIVKNGEEKILIDDIGKFSGDIYGSLSRLISLTLRHGTPLEFIVETLQKSAGLNSFEKVVARVLKKYIKDGEPVLVSETCPVCGSVLKYENGCKSCSACSWSKCS